MKVGKSNTKIKKKGERQMKKYIKNKCNENQVKENKCFNYNNGITLVALVVTIVVLLILAGVSINLVIGQNGLINRAKEAARKTQEAAEGEQKEFDTATDYIKQTIGVTAAGITAEDYGKVVTNYNADGKTWEIFYADNNNVYLITRNNIGSQELTITGYNGTSDFNGSETFKAKYPAVQAGWLNKTYTPSASGAGTVNYTSSYGNMKATEYLLDSSVWNTNYKTNKADWAIGGPTLEMLVASYNKKQNQSLAIATPTGYGYASTIPRIDLFNHDNSYWLACPSSIIDGTRVRYVYCGDTDTGYSAEYSHSIGVNPVVCLSSGVTLTPSSDRSTFTIN